MKKYLGFILLFISVFLVSCLNEEGEGGRGVVEGYVYMVLHPDGEYNFRTDTVEAAEARVYICYGNEEPYSDDMRTGPDGYYKFKYLTKGTYSILAYNEYPDDEKEVVKKTVSIRRNETGEVEPIYIHSGKMFGRHQIEGQLKAKFVSSDKNGIETLRQDTVGVAGERVFIRKKGITQPFDDIRTGEDGVFVFEKLPPGDYEVYSLSEDPFSRLPYILDENKLKGLIEVKILKEEPAVNIGTIYAKLRA